MLNQETVDKLTTPITKQKRNGCLPGPDFLQGYQDEVGRRSGIVRLHERVRGWQWKLKTQWMLQHPQPVNMALLWTYTTAGHTTARETGHSNWPGVILKKEGCSIIGLLFLPIQIWEKLTRRLETLSSLYRLKTYSAKQALNHHKTQSRFDRYFCTFQPCFALI